MTTYDRLPLRELDEDAALRTIIEGTATETGERFFAALVENLAKALSTQGAWVAEYIEETRKLRSLAAWMSGRFLSDYEYEIIGTPCEQVIDKARLVHFRENVAELFPDDSDLKGIGAVSYMGVPLMDLDGKILGNLAVLDSRPMPEEPGVLALFRIFAARATAELQRLRAESEVRQSEEKYRRIVETAGEGFVLMDKNLMFTDVNDAYCRMVGYSRQELIGKTVFDHASQEYKQFLLLKRDECLSKEYGEFEGVVVAKNGRHVPILVHGNTLTDDRGAVIGNMAFVTDMTEQKKSLELAGEVQKSLLPQKNLRIQGLDIAGKSIPCEEIGGDYFDYLLGEDYPDRPFSAVVGDITGHGVDAALLMTSARAFLRMRSSQPGSISQIVNEMNRHLTRDVLDTGRFMTLLYMTIDTDNSHLRWVRAGHDPAILYDPVQDKFEELKGDGLALGLDEKFTYEENVRTELASGQIIAIGTDGIWEAFNGDGEMYGKKRFHSVIRQNASAEANDILNAIYSDLDSFRSGLKAEDDITLVVIKIT
ncbi:MAG: SpoIIE family protein phosphatase [Deltaproteobacteria bacterium]|nr:SpoIIE family protein phosphatase [Deltaproteobacteria bacterium]